MNAELSPIFENVIMTLMDDKNINRPQEALSSAYELLRKESEEAQKKVADAYMAIRTLIESDPPNASVALVMALLEMAVSFDCEREANANG